MKATAQESPEEKPPGQKPQKTPRKPQGQVSGRQADPLFQPRNWSLRTKISIVLLLPVVVALTLAGARIQAELDQASKLSAVRDQLPVLRGTLDLAGLVDDEMIAAASGAQNAGSGNSGLAARMKAVDDKAAAVQRDADFARLAPGAGRDLNVALGRLSATRTSGASSGTSENADPLTEATGYRDIVVALSDVVPGVISAAGSSYLDGTARTTGALLQLRATLASEEALLRASAANQSDKSLLVAAGRAASEEAVLSDQIQRQLTGADARRFSDATASTGQRQDALRDALTSGRTSGLNGLVPPITTESKQVGGLLDGFSSALSTTVSERTNQARADALRDAALVLAALLAALAIALLTARSLVSPVRRLRAAALNAANRQLPDTIERVRTGKDVDWKSVTPVPVHGGDEIGQLARAFDDMHRQAVRLAGEQAELRRQVSEMFMTLSRRSQSLIELQLDAIEQLETDEEDPQRLERLFRLDHLATRLRRNGENLQVLAGGSPARQDDGPVAMGELLRGATSEVRDYSRISIVHAPNGAVRAHAAADIVHILAELLENATRFSPPDENVILTADRGSDGGLLVEVVDNGLGMTTEDLLAANQRLTAGDDVDPETTRRMGLFVVGRLAALHGVIVRLRPTMSGSGRRGITASVHVPGQLIIAEGLHTDTWVAGPTTGPQPRVNGTQPATSRGAPNSHRPPQQQPLRPQSPLQSPLPPLPEPAVPAVRTPIFDEVLSKWFIEMPPEQEGGERPASLEPERTVENWIAPVDETRRAAEAAVAQPATTFTPAGLPMRRPGQRLAPGTAAGRQPEPQQNEFRDPTAVRNNLSRHYDGMRAARMRTSNDRPSNTRPGNDPENDAESASAEKADTA